MPRANSYSVLIVFSCSSKVEDVLRALGRLLFICTALLLTTGCQRADTTAVPPATETEATSQPSSHQSPSPEESHPRVVFLGDSLTAGLGLETSEAFPALLEQQLTSEGLPVTVVNAGVSGDTTAGGLRRLSWILQQKPDVLVVCLGGNDGLRNLDVATSKENLRQIITEAKNAGTEVLLLGMMIPSNYGPEYREQFAAIFPALAEETEVPLVPFALEGVAGNPELNQPDGIHPTAEGQKIIAENVIDPLRELVEKQINKNAHN